MLKFKYGILLSTIILYYKREYIYDYILKNKEINKILNKKEKKENFNLNHLQYKHNQPNLNNSNALYDINQIENFYSNKLKSIEDIINYLNVVYKHSRYSLEIIDKNNKLIYENENHLKNNLLKNLKDANDNINKMNDIKLNLNDQISLSEENIFKQFFNYRNNLRKIVVDIRNIYHNEIELEDLRNDFKQKLFKLNLTTNELKMFDNKEIINKINYLLNEFKIFKQNEFNFISEKLNSDIKSVEDIYNNICLLNERHYNQIYQFYIVNFRQKEILTLYTLMQKIEKKYLKKKEELAKIFEEGKNKIANNKINEFVNEYTLKFNDYYNDLDSLCKFNINDKNLLADENFVKEFHRVFNLKNLFLVENLINKNDKENSVLFVNKLNNFNTNFNDKNTIELLNDSKLNSNIISSSDLKNDFYKIKEKIIECNLIKTFNKDNLFTCCYSAVLLSSINFLYNNFYNPKTITLKERDNNFIKKIKALRIIEYNLNENNYDNILKYINYLNDDYGVKEFKEKISIKKLQSETMNVLIDKFI